MSEVLSKFSCDHIPEGDSCGLVVTLIEQNAKLRELVRDMWPFVKAGWVHACPNRECRLFEECDADSEYECPIEEYVAGRMRELGVEVCR